jgi:LPXTG-site transpeptidase (sortase) family protein
MIPGVSAGAAVRRPRRWWVAAAALLLVAVVCLAVGLRSHLHPLAGPVGPQLPPPTAVSKGAAPAVAVVARSTPIALSIPAIGLDTSLSTLGLNPDGTVQVPTDIQEAGWYHLGPSPGQVGSAVILGHVDSYLGPAVFFQLPTLLAGDQVEVSLADGVNAYFVVDTVVMYPKDQFPTSLVYESHGYQALQLITCGGTFDPETGHYLSNVVVYTTLAWTTPVPSPATSAERVGERN